MASDVHCFSRSLNPLSDVSHSVRTHVPLIYERPQQSTYPLISVTSVDGLASSNAKDSAPRDVRSSSVKGDAFDLDRGVGVGVINVSSG